MWKLLRLFAVAICACELFSFGGASADFNLKVVDPSGRRIDNSALITGVRDKRAVFVGEEHDRYDNHLGELEVIRRLHEQDPERWAVGVEFIQRRFQPDLDSYVEGRISERDFLRKTEYFDRWGFDFRLYRLIFQYARDNHVPMIALNAERELSDKVAKSGLDELPSTDRERIPQQIDKSDTAYRDRLQKVFQQHPSATNGNFEHFFEAQLVWDETMAQRTSDYLESHPDKAVVVLAGNEHIAWGSGIPNRVKRRIRGLDSAILLIEDKFDRSRAGAADYFLISNQLKLLPAGAIGVTMNMSNGTVVAKQIARGGAAARAGMKAMDRIIAIDGERVRSIGDVRLALLDKLAGDVVTLRAERQTPTGEEDLMFQLRLRKPLS